MTATDELRSLLDERDITIYDYGTEVWWGGESSGGGGAKYTAYEQTDGLICVEIADLTPEQAVAATLGTGTYEMEYVSDFMSWHCKACDQMDMAPRNPKPRYCKWCGRKVVDK